MHHRATAAGAAQRPLRRAVPPAARRPARRTRTSAGVNPANRMDYSDYLHLDEVLAAQHPLSPDHNEMLFIIQHQTTELWMKLMLHELARRSRRSRRTSWTGVQDAGARSRIMEQLVHAWDVLSTMTPAEYSAIRPYLGEQQRLPELAVPLRSSSSLGNKSAAMLEAARAPRPTRWPSVEAACDAPSLYDEAMRLLARRGFAMPADYLERDWTQPYAPATQVEQAWLAVYRDPDAALGPVRARRGAGGPGGRVPPVALPPRDDGRARSSASSAAPAGPPAWAICARCSTSCCSPSCGRCAAGSDVSPRFPTRTGGRRRRRSAGIATPAHRPSATVPSRRLDDAVRWFVPA